MTHGVHWLPKVDKIVVLLNGIVSEVGSYEELISHDGAFAQFLLTYLNEEDEDGDPESKLFAFVVCIFLSILRYLSFD